MYTAMVLAIQVGGGKSNHYSAFPCRPVLVHLYMPLIYSVITVCVMGLLSPVDLWVERGVASVFREGVVGVR